MPWATPPATAVPPRPPSIPSSPILGPSAEMDQNDGCSEMLDILLLHTVLILYICSTRFEVEGVEGVRGGSAVAGGVAQGLHYKQ